MTIISTMTIISKEPGLTVNGQLTSSLLYFPKNRHISPYFADLGMKKIRGYDCSLQFARVLS
jgi:hypothetical protein